MSGPLGPYGPVLGMPHRYAYFSAGVIMGLICLISTIVTFILAKTHNDLKQRGRYLVFWNGLSATGVVTVYLMLNAFVGDFPCYILLWACYLCIVPWLLTYLARGWRLVFIYNQQVDFGRTILQKSATELNILHQNSNPNEGVSSVDNATGAAARIGVEGTKISVVEEKEGLDRANASSDRSQGGHTVEGSSSEATWLEKDVAGSTKHESAGDTTPKGVEQGAGVGAGAAARNIRTPLDTPTGQRLEAPLPPIPSRTLPQPPADTSPICHQLVVSIAPPSPLSDSPNSISTAIMNAPESNITSASDDTSPYSTQTPMGEHNDNHMVHVGTIKDSGMIHDTPSRTMSTTVDGEAAKEARSCSRYLPFNQATDGRLTVFLVVFMIVPLAICLGMQFIKPSPVQINPVSYKCGEGPVFYPIYAFMLGFLAIGCPVLTFKLWWIKDGFGIRNELLITMIIGLPGFALYFLSPIYLKRLDAGHWNHVNWLTITIFLAHVNSVVLPLIQFFMRQRPKQRSGKNLLTGIFRWDSTKSFPGTPTMDMNSDSSSFHFHSRSSSQVLSPQIVEPCDLSIFERQSLGHQSVISQNIQGFPSDEYGNSSIQVSQSGTTGQSQGLHHRRRGMKGFWAKYGKDADGNIIPLSQMNPRAFEYALQDLEMLGELVKFSVTVFSAENAKFLQEYEGLRRQVREYYRLITQGRSQGSKHSRQLSDVASSAMAPTEDGSVRGSNQPSGSHRKKSSIFGSVASSIHSKLSKYGSSSVDNSARANSDSNHNSSISAQEDGSIIAQDGDPGCSSPRRTPGPNTTKSIGKRRHDLRGHLWRLSLQSSLRQSNTSQSSPQSSMIDDAASQVTVERRSMSSPTPISPSRVSTEMSHRHKASDITVSSLDEASDSNMNGFSENESDRSSFSWYGRGKSGSALSYHDVTPSELSSYQDTASETFGAHTGYFGGGGDTDSIGEYNRGGSDDVGSISVSIVSLREHQQGCEGPSQTSGCPCPIPILSKRATESTASSQDHVRSSSAPSSRGTIQSPTSPRHHAHHSAESSPFGSLVGNGNQEGISAYTTMKQQQGRLNQSFTTSPFHSPSSSVSAPFTPRLPSQPQLHSPSTIRASQGLISRSVSARTILTAEDYRQLQHNASPNSSTASSSPLSPLSTQQQQPQQPHITTATLSAQGVSSPLTQHLQQLTPSITSSVARASSQSQTFHQHHHRHHNRLRSDLGSRGDLHSDVVMPMPNGRTPTHVSEIKRLFATNGCYLEMYEPIVREVQELVYSNVWPRFIQSIQRQPQGFPGKFKRTWKAFFGTGPEDQGDGIFDGRMGGFFGQHGRGVLEHGGHSAHQQGEERRRGSDGEEGVSGVAAAAAAKNYLPSPPPPQASYIHGRFAYLGGPDIPGLEGPTGNIGQDEKDGIYGEEQLDFGRFGVMQDLDLSALQRIVVDPK
ncbi:hypothetical protein BGZ95_011668 [Linnemannia exigua]|uniref:RGS domain-containing protein n=1 Tax=Linnemannia exigua TaxID=604196 RepID=A0AAD4DK07_9FUNG|nr:hypothetical protein BGZ95_011668 [Linnemannia exigua]